MLSTGFSIGLLVICALTVAFCVAIVVWLRRMHDYVQGAVTLLQNQNKRSVSLAKLAELESTLTELLDSYDSLLASHKKLRSRIGMRQNRARRSNGVDSDVTAPPASEEERSAYKKALRDAARQKGHRGL